MMCDHCDFKGDKNVGYTESSECFYGGYYV